MEGAGRETGWTYLFCVEGERAATVVCVCVCVWGGGGWQDDWGRRGTLNMCSQAEHTARDRVQWAILYRHHFLAVYIAAPERNSLCSSPPPPPPPPFRFCVSASRLIFSFVGGVQHVVVQMFFR